MSDVKEIRQAYYEGERSLFGSHGKIIAFGADLVHDNMIAVPKCLLRMWEKYII